MIVLRHITNPIEWQETHHQRRNTLRLLKRWRLAGPLLLALVFAAIVLTLRDVTAPTRELGILTIWILHAVTAARAIAAGANAVSREHTGQTWIPLILTGVGARRILLGKWLAVMHHVAPWMLALGATRLLMLPVFMLAFINRFAWRAGYRTSAYYDGYAMIEWVGWASGLAVVMTVALTVLEVACCAALGLAASAVTRRGGTAMIAAMCIRFTPVALFAAFTRYEIGLGPSWRVLRFTPLAVADGGSAPLYQMVLPLTPWTTWAHIQAVDGLLLATGLLLLLLAGALVVAWLGIRAAGALPEATGARLTLFPRTIIRRQAEESV